MFDYKKFENDVVAVMENTLRKWMNEYEDIYILSLDCERDMSSIGIFANTKQYLEEQSAPESEDYLYYKYCEEEWSLCDAGGFLAEISSYMKQYIEENKERFTNPESYEYMEAFDEHCDKIIETCKKALKRFRQSIREDFPDLLLSFNIREYLDDEERTEFFALVNSKDALEEYKGVVL